MLQDTVGTVFMLQWKVEIEKYERLREIAVLFAKYLTFKTKKNLCKPLTYIYFRFILHFTH